MGLGAFKYHLAIWFFQGALLKDERKLLINAQEKTTNAMRQFRYKSYQDIDIEVVNAYVLEAIENQKAGKEILPNRNKPLIIPDELKKAFSDDPEIKRAFEKFSKSKKREFAAYVSSAKREDTRHKRVEKIIPLILEGIGLNDKYR